MMDIAKKRRADITFLNILFCFLVILIHISSEVITQMDRGQTLYWMVLVASKLSAFVVPGFIMLSGVKLFLRTDSLRYGKFYLSRITSVVLPYIVWVFIYYLYFCSKNYFVFSWAEFGYFLLYGDISAHFYFVVVIVQFYLFVPLWVLFFKKANPAVALLFSLMITVICSMSLNEILVALFPGRTFDHLNILFLRYLVYWVAGCMIGIHYQEFKNYLKRRWISITLLFLVCGFLVSWVTIVFPGGGFVWMDQVYIIYCMSALLFFYMVAQLFAEGGAVLIKPLGWLNDATYHIYLVHCLVIVIANDLMTQRGITNLEVRFGWRALIAYVGSILFCVLWQAVKRLLVKVIQKT